MKDDEFWDDVDHSVPQYVEPTEERGVKRDGFDKVAWDMLLGTTPNLKNQVEAFESDFETSRPAHEDLFNLLNQGDPRFVDDAEMLGDYLPQKHMLERSFVESPDFQKLREHTKYDEYQTAFSMLALEEPLRKAFEDLEEAKKRAQEQAEQAAQQGGRGDPSGQDPNGAPGQPDPNGQPLEIPAGLVEDLQAATRGVVKDIEDANQAASAFGVDPGELQRMSFDERRRLGERLSSDKLKRLAKLIGSWRQYADAERRRKVRHMPSEIHGVKVGNDLTRLPASEIINLATPELEESFWLRWAQHGLLNNDMQGTEKVGRGPVIVVCDESGSMGAQLDKDGNTREMWSKAVSLALCDQARRDGRDFHYIGFASGYEQYHLQFPGGVAKFDDVINFVEHFFCGGTSYVEPLTQAMGIVEGYDKTSRQPDVVFITDDECRVPDEFMAKWQQFRADREVRCYGVAVGVDGYRNHLKSLADRCINIDKLNSDPEGLGELFCRASRFLAGLLGQS